MATCKLHACSIRTWTTSCLSLGLIFRSLTTLAHSQDFALSKGVRPRHHIVLVCLMHVHVYMYITLLS